MICNVHKIHVNDMGVEHSSSFRFREMFLFVLFSFHSCFGLVRRFANIWNYRCDLRWWWRRCVIWWCCHIEYFCICECVLLCEWHLAAHIYRDFNMIPGSFKDFHSVLLLNYIVSPFWEFFFLLSILSFYLSSLFRWELTCVTCWFIGFGTNV